MIAELLDGGDMRADGNILVEDLYRLSAALDDGAARAGSLKSDEDDGVLGIREAMDEMVQDASSGRHATGGDDDLGKMRVVDLLGVFLFRLEGEALPLER